MSSVRILFLPLHAMETRSVLTGSRATMSFSKLVVSKTSRDKPLSISSAYTENMSLLTRSCPDPTLKTTSAVYQFTTV